MKKKNKRTAGIIAFTMYFLSFPACQSDDITTEDAPRVYSVSGVVTLSDGGAALGASVMLLNVSDGSDAGQSSASTTGAYIITGVSAGSYKIAATLADYETDTIEDVNVIDSDVTDKDIVLQKLTVPTYTIAGTVSKPDGNAAAGVSVQVRNASDHTGAGQGVTNASGVYSISGIPAGTYNIVAALDGYETGILAGVTVEDSGLVDQNITLQTITANARATGIVYSDNDVTVDNLPADGSITVTKSGADLTIASSSSAQLVELEVSGSTSGGSLKIQNNAAVPNTLRLTLNNAAITSLSKLPPIQITKNEGTTVIELKGNNFLSDHPSNEENAALISKSGSLELEGYGALTISGAAKHALSSSEKSITVRGGDITVTSAISDGVHAGAGFVHSGGTLNITASGDGIDAGTGLAAITGGNIRVVSSTGGAKGIKAGAGITVAGGNISVVTSGATVLEPLESGYNPSHCTAIKSDAHLTVTGGTIQIESLAAADGGKGLSADGDIVISGGTVNISVAGSGKVYTSPAGSTDSYTAACIKSDQNIALLGGNVTCSSSGSGGKCVNAAGTITIGNQGANNAALVLTAGTSGERFYVSGNSGGGGQGRPGGGGGFGGNSADYANPKAIRCEGNLTVNSGTVLINCTQKTEGGEGLESKGLLTVNGGNIDIRTYDDCINAGTGIVINGGNIFCAASGQDAIDSNAALTVNGGLTIANGVRGDGEAFDSERNFQVNGGIIVGTHGGGMSMSSPAGQQRSVSIQGAAGSAIGIQNAVGETLLLFNIPVIAGATAGTSVTVIFSDPRLVSGSYSLLSGGSISGGTTVNGYNTGGSYSGGTSREFSVK